MGRWINPGSSPITIRPEKSAPIVVAPGEIVCVADSLDEFIKRRGYYVRPVEPADERKPFSVDAFITAILACESADELRTVDARFAMPSADAIPKKLQRKIEAAIDAKVAEFAAKE